MSLKKRSEIPIELTWNTQDLYQREELYEKDFVEVVKVIDEFRQRYMDKLDSVEQIRNSVKDYAQVLVILTKIQAYAGLESSVDKTEEKNVMREGKLSVLLGQQLPRLSFYKSQLLAIDEALLKSALEEFPEGSTFLKDILRQKPYQLEPESEALVSAYAPTFGSFYEIYETFKQVDMEFEPFNVEGKEYPLSFVLFENRYQYSQDTKVRRKAFENFSKTLKRYESGFGANYNAHLQREKTNAQLRGFDSVFDSLLFSQKVEKELYHRQIDVIMRDLAPVMRKYAKVIQKKYGLEKMTYADLKTPLDPEFAPSVTIEEGWNYVEDALAVMGEEYLSKVKEARKGRWVDFANNVGKSTGGFCSTPYGVHPYILLSWTGLLSEVFTLAHEIGHGVHFLLAQKEHSILQCTPSTYMIEAPSTFNEMLLTNHLREKSTDPRFKRWVLSAMIENTYYHNFVTHLLEAHYQREVYKLIDKGEVVTGTLLSQLKKKTLEEFWGDAVEITEGAELTWMRQPHYFMGLYPYTYSAGLTVATVASRRVLRKEEGAIEDWLNLLKSGGVYRPLEMAKIAGVDIETDLALKETIGFIDSLVTEVIEISETL